MYSFEGDYRRKPQQSLRGASKKAEKEELLKLAQEKRLKREDQRNRQENALKIQKFYRGYVVRKQQNDSFRAKFDKHVQSVQRQTPSQDDLGTLAAQLCLFYRDDQDGSRLVWLCQQLVKQKDLYLASVSRDPVKVWLCQQLVKQKDVYLASVSRDPVKGHQQIRGLLMLCLRYLASIADTAQPIAIPVRMLEVFTARSSYNHPDKLTDLWRSLMQQGYFDCMRKLLNAKVPSSLEKGPVPPTPVAASILDLIMNPISYTSTVRDNQFSNYVLTMMCKSLLCPIYTEQISLFLLPAMAYGKYPFPFVDLVQTLITQCREGELGEGKNRGTGRVADRGKEKVELSPWLLGAFMVLASKHLDSMSMETFSLYVQVLQRLLPLLPVIRNEDDEDSDSEEEMDTSDNSMSLDQMQELRDVCLTSLESPIHIQKTLALVGGAKGASTGTDMGGVFAVAVICHCLISQHKFTIHRRRLLYRLAYNQSFIRYLWRCCVTVSTVTATGTSTPLIMMLCRGLTMSSKDVGKILPVLATFCAMFSHSLHTLHDADFYGDDTGNGSSSSMPFTLDEIVQMVMVLRDVCLGIIELAHPDARPTVNDDYRIALNKTGARLRTANQGKESNRLAIQWGYLFKVTAVLVRQVYMRDSRRPFCFPREMWLSDRVSIQADGPSPMYGSVFTQRPFRTMQSLTKVSADDEGPPLSNKDVKNLVILTELPFVVSFRERVKILFKLINKDKEDQQGDMHHFMAGPSVDVTIRRNYIYEDAFDKLSPENEPNLKLKMRVQLVNAAGLDEAGIDGGGIFREFLSCLLKSGFDPNRGFFAQTTDRQLYPNPQASALTDDYTKHYFFLGRMLGKAIYENMLVELPFASFFLSKILSRHSGDLDIHHLASLDPEMYKNLLFLKHYDGDVNDLGLDFTVADDQFGETMIEELKPGGRNIPVTANNRIEYIHLMADYKLNKQIRSHCLAFRRGMSDLINLEWLRMFDHQELEVLIAGATVPVDLDDLKQHTNYSGGYTADHPVIKMFWETVAEFTDQQKRQLLKFVTSCSRPPLLGFKDLYPALAIHYGGSEPDRLPTASTCMNLLKLPECHDQATLKQKLLYAIESGAGFELS